MAHGSEDRPADAARSPAERALIDHRSEGATSLQRSKAHTVPVPHWVIGGQDPPRSEDFLEERSQEQAEQYAVPAAIVAETEHGAG